MSNKSKITIAELSEIIGITEKAVKKNIAKLKKEGKIERVGPDKGGYWKVKKNI